jgi:anti-sigma-K factor RskA
VSGERGTRRDGDHGVFDELAVGWALHSLEPEDETLFARHLLDCARCARTVAETADVMAALATDLPQVDPSPGLRDRLRAAVERTEQAPPGMADDGPDLSDLPDLDDDLEVVVRAAQAPAPPRRAAGFPGYEHRGPPGALDRPSWRRALPAALVAAAVAAVLGLGTWIVIIGDARNQAETTAAQQAEIVHRLLRPGQATIAPLSEHGQVVATVVAREGQVQVVADGLTVNDAGNSVYVVWGMQGDTPVALGTFDVVRPQMDLLTVGSDQTGLDDYPAYAVSIEQGRSAPSTPTHVVAEGQVTS